MMNAIITMMPNVTVLVKPISGAIKRPNITAGTTIRKDTINLETKLIVCFLPQFEHLIGLYELQIDNNNSFQLKLFLHTSHFCKSVPPMAHIYRFLSYHNPRINGLSLIGKALLNYISARTMFSSYDKI
jgi:hypothetical protein